jgi:acyl-CoA thioester hydrolase
MSRNPEVAALLADYPVVIELPVTWGQMDAFSHVNNTVYFRYFEDARLAYYERLALPGYMAATGVGPILSETRCRFRIPLEYPDSVAVGARVAALHADRYLMRYAVVSLAHRKLAAEGEGMLVSFDYRTQAKAPIPEHVVAAIRALEGARLEQHAGEAPG